MGCWAEAAATAERARAETLRKTPQISNAVIIYGQSAHWACLAPAYKDRTVPVLSCFQPVVLGSSCYQVLRVLFIIRSTKVYMGHIYDSALGSDLGDHSSLASAHTPERPGVVTAVVIARCCVAGWDGLNPTDHAEKSPGSSEARRSAPCCLHGQACPPARNARHREADCQTL